MHCRGKQAYCNHEIRVYTTMNKERGNILFLILLAVVLFAALAYAVTSSMRGGGKSATDEKARSLASAIIQYGSLVQNTVNRAMLVSNVPEYGFDFDDSTGQSMVGANSTCTATACRLFAFGTRDGLISPVKFGEEIIDPRRRALFPSMGGGAGPDINFYMIQVLDVGTSLPDVVMVLMGLKPEVCKAINEILWNDGASYGTEFFGAAELYQGALTSLPSVPATSAIYGNDSVYFKGKAAACTSREGVTNPNGPYGGDFYQVLIER